MSTEPHADLYAHYMSVFTDGLRTASATDAGGAAIALDTAVRSIGARMRACHDGGRRIMLVGNGGSAGICSHLATDFSKNGGMRATAFNDGSVLTCLGNDYGYEHVFAKQIEWHAVEGDMLIAISSSGRSMNILNAVAWARKLKCTVVTLSGFKPDNPLRGLGDINIYFPSPEYGFVEVGHLAILHAALDIQMGWQGNT
jgi:D-sedoheptulose 7-phosphate isomerase